ncbi:hypothetical protein HY224_01485, partial [Candidatus Uhrbacteria bacterium]|nr:hypothetical protein [Candidatus Uhrbacteria bacterium]
RWAEKKIPRVPASQVFTPPDNIADVSWSDLEGKVIMCTQSGRPFKLVRPEFEFYKKYSLPLPRLHPEVRLFNRYPRDLMFNLHEAKCSSCQTNLTTSMHESDKVLCEKCYNQAVS